MYFLNANIFVNLNVYFIFDMLFSLSFPNFNFFFWAEIKLSVSEGG